MNEHELCLNTIKHKFLDHQINPATETLIIGTFNPAAVKNDAEFFYSRPKNYLWTHIPLAFDEKSLKQKKIGEKEYENKLNEKKAFIEKHRIDFIDLISEVRVEEGQETNYDDDYIDSRVPETGWRDVVGEIKKLHSLKRACFTRRTLSDIPQMRKRIELIQSCCQERGVHFQFVTTPGRPLRKDRPNEWSEFIKAELSLG
jgi:G:T/U-mismatch repair DNA glycosylase